LNGENLSVKDAELNTLLNSALFGFTIVFIINENKKQYDSCYNSEQHYNGLYMCRHDRKFKMKKGLL